MKPFDIVSAAESQAFEVGMNQRPLVIAVILNWNKAQQSADCVLALSEQTYTNLNIVVVDNGSQEETVGPPLNLNVPFLLLRNPTNLGFTGGVNVGLQRAMSDGADYVWLVNNDAFPAPDALELMVNAMCSDPSIGLASGMIRNGDAGDEVEFCGGLWDEDTFQTTNDVATYESWHDTRAKQIWLVGTALLIRRSLIESIGLFDNQFFAYWEDNDYSVRSIQAGFFNVVVPAAVVYHFSGAPKTDPGTKPPHYYYYMARNEILFLRKHVSIRRLPKLLVWALNRQFRKLDQLEALHVLADAVLCGICDGLRGLGGAYDAGRGLMPAARQPLRSLIKMLRR